MDNAENRSEDVDGVEQGVGEEVVVMKRKKILAKKKMMMKRKKVLVKKKVVVKSTKMYLNSLINLM